MRPGRPPPLARCAAAALAIAALALGTGAQAQDAKAEMQKLYAAAKSEGPLTIDAGTNPPWRDYIVKHWQSEFPGLRINVVTIDMSDLLVRIEQERKQGRFLWDASASGSSGPLRMVKKGFIADLNTLFVLPELKAKDEKVFGNWEDAWNDKEQKYVFRIGAYLKTPFYNAKLVPPEEVKAKGLQILFDPKYKGKIYWHAPWIRGSGRSFGWMLYRRFGKEGLAKLVKEQQVKFMRSQNDLTAAMARGQVAIGIGPPFEGLLDAYEKAGVKLNAHPFGNSPEVAEMAPGGFNLAAFDHPANPNAQKLFVNWMLSKDTVAGLAKATGQTLRRQDVPSPEDEELRPIPGKRYTEAQNVAQQDGSDMAAAYIRSLVEK